MCCESALLLFPFSSCILLLYASTLDLSKDIWLLSYFPQTVLHQTLIVALLTWINPKTLNRIQNVLYSLTMAILITTVLLLFYASPFIPFIFQFLMIGFLLLFSLPSKEDSTQSSQFEIWVFFFVATILPFILYSTASSSAFFSSPLQFIINCIVLFFSPSAVFLGLLSVRFYPWMSSTPTLPSL